MLGYSEPDLIYFSLNDQTGFAMPGNSGVFKGLPDFKYIHPFSNMSLCHRRCHAAEHKTYNAFKNKIQGLAKDSPVEVFKDYLPSYEEIQAAPSFNIFCATSFIFSSSISVILMCLPNLLHYKNTEIAFMSFWLCLSVCVFFLLSYLIQSRHLAKPENYQILLARQALKEVLYGNNYKSKPI